MDEPFRLLASRVVGTFGFLAVAEEEFAGPDGEFVRWTVRHPGAVVVVPVEDGPDGPQAVLVRQFRSAVGRDVLEVPAGKRDVHGEPPETTARRELEEEIARRPGRLVKLAEFFNSPGFTDEYTHLFAAADLEPVESRHELRAEEREMTVERVPLARLEALIASGEMVDAKSMIGLFLARDWWHGDYAGLARPGPGPGLGPGDGVGRATGPESEPGILGGAAARPADAAGGAPPGPEPAP
jgi:ADP-ribose pyrophosphatase